MANNSLKKKKVYKHLSEFERDIISDGIYKGKKQYQIALEIGRSPSTVSREIKRNSLHSGISIYFPIRAQIKADLRKFQSRQKERLKNPEVRSIVSKYIRLGWTPEQIAGFVNKSVNKLKTNHESIYMYIYNYAREYIPYLARSHRKRKKRIQKQGKRAVKIPNRILIDNRPNIINERKRVGDWEADTVVSRKSKTTLVVLRERKLQKIIIKKIQSRTSENFNKAIISMLKPIPKNFVKSITFDNGLENAKHEMLSELLNVKTYFCNPYHSWEKGSIENSIGLIRRFFPKKTDFSLISDSEIRYIESLLNNRPRKSLGFKTPNQIFLNCIS